MSSQGSSVNRVFRVRIHLAVLCFFLPCFQTLGQEVLPHPSPDSLLLIARNHQSRGEYSHAILTYREYLQLRPGDDDVCNEMARTFAWNAQYDSALSMYDEVLQRAPRNFDARYGRCQTLAWTQNRTAALKEVDSFLRDFPGNVDVLLLAARINLWGKNLTRSLELSRQVLLEDPENVPGMIGVCAVLQAMGDIDEAYTEVSQFRQRVRGNKDVERLFESLAPKRRNQLFLRFQNEHFSTGTRSDFRTFEAQFYRTLSHGLTLFAQADAYRRFGQDDQSFGVGGYYAPANGGSFYGYLLASPDPKVTSSVDATLEYTHEIFTPVSAFLAYRLLAFKTETAHILSPGFTWAASRAFEVKPRIFISRTIVGKTTSYAFSVQGSYTRWSTPTPYVFYSVGTEAYRGVTLDNVESVHSWSITVGCKYDLNERIVVRGYYQFLSRIGSFHDNSLDVGLGYYW